MKKILLIISAFTFSSLFVLAQDQDPKAKAILDELSKKTKAYKTITSEYAYTVANKDKKQLEKWTGKVLLKGNKFKLDIPGNKIVSDAKTIWAHNKDAGEVTIKNFDGTNEDQLSPFKLFFLIS